MANIIRSQSLSIGTPTNRQHLYDILSTSQLNAVDTADLGATALRGIVTSATEPPTLVHGQLWWDMDWQVMRVFDSNASFAVAVGPDIFQGIARAMCPIPKGYGIKIDPVQCKTNIVDAGLDPRVFPPYVQLCGEFGGHDYLTCIGVAAATSASGALFPFTYRGFAEAYVVGAEFGQVLSSPALQLAASSAYTGCFAPIQQVDSEQTHTTIVGIIMDEPWNTTDSNASRCVIVKWWGPRRFPRVNL